MSADRQRLPDGGEDAAHGRSSLGRPGRTGEQGRKRATVEVGDRVLRPSNALEARAELLQQQPRVSGLEGGGDGVEAVHVEDGDREGQASALGVLQRLARALFEERGVGQAGRRIVEPPVGRQRVALVLGLLVHAYLAYGCLATVPTFARAQAVFALGAGGSCGCRLKHLGDSGTLRRS